MTNISNKAGSLISLPKGGGALKGLGEKFATDPHTGTGSFSVPLDLPAGRNEFQPALALEYSTGHGQGLHGLGWALTVPRIVRKTTKGVPRYRDAAPLSAEADVFVLSGAEDLVPVAYDGSTGTTFYQPRTEGLFAEISRVCLSAASLDYWRVRTKDGLVSYYGTNPADSPRYTTPNAIDPASVRSVDDPQACFAWELSLTLDPFGNRIEYLYDRSQSTPADFARGRRWNVPLLRQIRYADRGDRTSPEFVVTVDFEYEARPDPFSDYRAGFEIRQVQRCRAIRTRTHAVATRSVKEYRLGYIEDAKTRASLLGAIEVYGFDDGGVASASMPALRLAYSAFEPELPSKRELRGLRGQLPARSLADPSLALVDLRGQGLPDLLQLGASAQVFRNLGDGVFEQPRPLRTIPDGLWLNAPDVQLMDADGDGRMDLVVTRPSQSGYFPLRFAVEAAATDFQRHERSPTVSLKDPEVRLFDLTGDGVVDALRTGSRLECYFNQGPRGFIESRFVERRPLAEFPDVVFSDPRVLIADMSGDGLADIVLVHSGAVCYWPNFGYGRFGARVEMANAPALPWAYDPQRLLIGDINGDGLADLVYVDDRRVYVWINQAGNAFCAPIVIEGTPQPAHNNAVRVVDLLGSGIPGILFTQDQTEAGRDHYVFLDLTGASKPYLLTGVENDLGASTQIEYRSSTAFCLDDERARTPWQTTLPFPVQTVSKVILADAFSDAKLVTEYSYHHGYWDGFEREFRGFGRVEQRDTELRLDGSLAPAPLLRKSWFELGAVTAEHGAFRTVDLSTEYWSEDPSVLFHQTLVEAALVALEQASSALTSAQRRRRLRDALRSLRGSLLRSELYGVDGSPRAGRPYTVNESAFGFREETPPQAARLDRLRIYFPHLIATRTSEWERGVDPLTQCSWSSRYDGFGQLLSQTNVACPRGWRRPDVAAAEGYLATRVLTAYAQPESVGPYIHDRKARTDVFELTATDNKTLAQVVATLDDDLSLVRVSQQLYRYDGAAFEGVELGRIGSYGALTRSETLVHTTHSLSAAYGAKVPVYLSQSAGTWPPEYPNPAVPSFRSSMPAWAGHVWHTGAESDWLGAAAGLFAITERVEYDFQASTKAAARGLVTRRRNPLGHETSIAYTFDLLLSELSDPVQLVTRVEYDLRFFQPVVVTDPNGNQQRFEFRPDGLLGASWFRGKTALEGDRSRASTQYTYDTFAYKDRGQPISATLTRYVHHDSEPGLDAAALAACVQSREYTDGLGRTLQTRSLGEQLRFGDPTFGSGVLPADPLQALATAADVTTHRASSGTNPHVTVSGWQTYDSKGRITRKYEPFFAEGWQYTAPVGAQRGEHVRLDYDPRGQLLRTVQPDGSEESVVRGVPGSISAPDLASPALYEPTPWETYTYDANDNSGRTHVASSSSYQHVRDTPKSIVVDALGRTVRSVERNRAPNASVGTALETYVTRYAYDIQGQLTQIIDPLNRSAFRHVYDLSRHRLYTNSLDAGESWVVFNSAGAEIERRDSKGALIVQQYDALQRPKRSWARDTSTGSVTLRGYVTYGDELPASAQAAAKNLLGKPCVQRDGAGQVTFESYDFKGNLLEKTRAVIADAEIAAQVDASAELARKYIVDWDVPTSLDGAYTTTVRYDALNRPVSTQLPLDEVGERKVVLASYNAAGALESIRFAGKTFIEHIAYDPKGRRVLVAYGNGYFCRYAYDPKTQRVLRMRTEQYQLSGSTQPVYTPSGNALQDFSYVYDLLGNVLRLRDRSADAGVLNVTASTDELEREFAYDATSRLVSATGRESSAQASWPLASASGNASSNRSPFAQGVTFGTPGNVTGPDRAAFQTGIYRESYRYDPAGNLLELWHKSGSRSAWTRSFGMGGLTADEWSQAIALHRGDETLWPQPPTNRLTHVGDAVVVTTPTHEHDANGNLLRENGSRHFAWTQSNQLAAFSVRATSSGPASIEVCYLYDGAGQRVKKWLRKAGQTETSTYVDGVFERHTNATVTNNSVHLLLDQVRVATVRVGDAFADDGAQDIDVKYTHGDHLGSCYIVIGVSQASHSVLFNREEHFPYGETSYGGFARKRYRYTGVERDEETGLGYHSARHYQAWAGRWLNPDPLGAIQGPNAFLYAGCNPLCRVDRGGTEAVAANGAPGSAQPAPSKSSAEESSAPEPPSSEQGFWKSIVSGREEASFKKSLIPVLGSLQNANYNFDKGNWGWGTFYTLLAITDVFLVRSLVTGAFRVAARGAVALKGFVPTLLKELNPSKGVGSATGFFTKLQRLFIQDRANYNASASVVFRVLSEHFTIATSKGSRSLFEMHHWLIQHAWYAGKNAIGNSFLRKVLQRLGDSGLNLVPIPGPINNALGKSALATASFAQHLASSIKAEVEMVANEFAPLFNWAKGELQPLYHQSAPALPH